MLGRFIAERPHALLVGVILLLAVFAACPRPSSAVPSLMNYQGYLTDNSGNPSSGSFAMTFRLFPDSTTGAAVWTESYASVTVMVGVFNVVLGTVAPLPPTLFGGAKLWLQTTVNGADVLPRRPLVTVAYSFRSAVADSAAAGGDLWSASGADVYRPSGNVGIGTSTPTVLLDMRRASGQAVAKLQSGSNSGSLLLLSRYGVANSYYLEAGAAAIDNFAIHRGIAPYADFVVSPTGNIGIGTNSPETRLHVVHNNANGIGLILQRSAAGQSFGDVDWRDETGARRAILSANAGGGPDPHFTFVLASGPKGSETYETDMTILPGGTVTVPVLEITGGSDLAEPFKGLDAKVPDGALVTIDETHPGQLKMSDRPYDKRVAGVVSGANGIKPGISLRQQGALTGDRNVALSGRVYALADASSGPIRPGDLLTTSAVPGHCMRATNRSKARGAVIGKAMSFLDKGQGVVLVLVSLE